MPEPSGPADVRESILEVAGLRSPVVQSGPEADTQAVVFVHGNPGSSEDWRYLVGRVGTFARAVAIDFPGFGKADKPEDGFDYTVAGYAEHLHRVLSTLGITRAHLVLHDFGGPWGLAWAAAHPAAFASAVLIDTGVLVGYRWHYLARIWRAPVVGEAFMATANRAGFGLLLRHGNPSGLPRAFVDRMFEDFDAGTKRAVLRLYRASGDIAGLSDQLGNALRRLNRPALVVWGAHDPYIRVEQADRQRQSFPGAQVVVLPNSGHWPFADDPAGVAGVVVPFLRSVTAGAPPGTEPEESRTTAIEG